MTLLIDLRGRTAVVTGGGGGIGRAIAIRLAEVLRGAQRLAFEQHVEGTLLRDLLAFGMNIHTHGGQQGFAVLVFRFLELLALAQRFLLPRLTLRVAATLERRILADDTAFALPLFHRQSLHRKRMYGPR